MVLGCRVPVMSDDSNKLYIPRARCKSGVKPGFPRFNRNPCSLWPALSPAGTAETDTEMRDRIFGIFFRSVKS